MAAVVLLCQATAWVHGAMPHVTCLEHGESMHLAAGQEAAAGERPVLAVVPAEAAAHAHEHCNLQGPRTTSAPTPDQTLVLAPVLSAAGPAPRRAPPPVGLLHLAPKTSPPRTPVV